MTSGQLKTRINTPAQPLRDELTDGGLSAAVAQAIRRYCDRRERELMDQLYDQLRKGTWPIDVSQPGEGR